MRPVWILQPVKIAGVLLVSALALVLSGCDKEPATSTTTDQTTTTTVVGTTITASSTTSVSSSVLSTSTSSTTDSSITTTTEALSSAEIRQSDGSIKGMGFIDRVWESGGVRYLSIDYAEFLAGEEGRQAAIEVGYIQPDEDLPNDYFIRNVSSQLREFTVAESATITANTWDGTWDRSLAWSEFLSFWGSAPPEGADHMHLVPWWITRNGGQVISIDEQYVP